LLQLKNCKNVQPLKACVKVDVSLDASLNHVADPPVCLSLEKLSKNQWLDWKVDTKLPEFDAIPHIKKR